MASIIKSLSNRGKKANMLSIVFDDGQGKYNRELLSKMDYFNVFDPEVKEVVMKGRKKGMFDDLYSSVSGKPPEYPDKRQLKEEALIYGVDLESLIGGNILLAYKFKVSSVENANSTLQQLGKIHNDLHTRIKLIQESHLVPITFDLFCWTKAGESISIKLYPVAEPSRFVKYELKNVNTSLYKLEKMLRDHITTLNVVVSRFQSIYQLTLDLTSMISNFWASGILPHTANKVIIFNHVYPNPDIDDYRTVVAEECKRAEATIGEIRTAMISSSKSIEDTDLSIYIAQKGLKLIKEELDQICSQKRGK